MGKTAPLIIALALALTLPLPLTLGQGRLLAQAPAQTAQAPAAEPTAPGTPGAQENPAIPENNEKPLTARSSAHLYELISREPPLSKQEILAYEQNLENIVALDTNPALLPELLETTGWSQERLTYVVTKIGVGLSNILDPENPRLFTAPDFVHPTPAERELIVDRLNDLVKAYQNLTKPKPEPKGKKQAG
ncbi:MAG: hypothetical protein LBJ61_02685 [Deltaproteobacteria bacterium]|jgi:hypothetical protein|nr:hypothetical protein [Deltaproteobacteria bacterium]